MAPPYPNMPVPNYPMQQPDFSGFAQAPSSLSVPPMAFPKVKKGGMFGSGYGIAQALSDGLNGYLAAGGNPVGIANIQAQHAQRMREAEEAARAQAYQQQRTDSNADWMNHYNFELDHPKPTNNDTVADYQFITDKLGPDAGKDYLRNKADPPQFMNVPGVGLVSIPRQGPSQGPSGPPPQAVDYLRKNPSMKADFDAKYGPGAADRALGQGGTGGNVGGGFL